LFVILSEAKNLLLLPNFSPDVYCRELYERLVSKGKAKKLALVAVAHKLLRQAYGVLKNKRPFDENFCT